MEVKENSVKYFSKSTPISKIHFLFSKKFPNERHLSFKYKDPYGSQIYLTRFYHFFHLFSKIRKKTLKCIDIRYVQGILYIPEESKINALCIYIT